MGGDRVECGSPRGTQKPFNSETTNALHCAELASGLRRAETTAKLPSLIMDDERENRRRPRNASSTSHLARSRSRVHQHPVSVNYFSPVAVSSESSKRDPAVSIAAKPRDPHQYGIQNIIGRFPPKKFTPHSDGSDPFAEEFSHFVQSDLKLDVRRPSDDPRMYASSSFPRQSQAYFSSAVAASAVLPYEPPTPTTSTRDHREKPDARDDSMFSPESNYSRWSNEVATPRTVRRNLTAPMTTLNLRMNGSETPNDERVVTPTSAL